MYDRRLDAIIETANTGSFTQAGRRLHLSTPAITQQITTFEHEYGLTLFDRSRAGVTLTAAGSQFVDDAQSIIRQSNEIIRRARQRSHPESIPVRLGISMLRPAKRILDLWQHGSQCRSQPSIRLELVQLPDDSTSIDDIIAHLGESVDVIATAFVPDHWQGICNTLSLSYEPLCLAVPRSNPLSHRATLTIDDLAGTRIRILTRGNGTDDIARDLIERNSSITLVNIDQYSLDVFNDCSETGDLLISKPMWRDVHPQLVNVPVDWPEPVGMWYGLMYPRSPIAQVAAFAERIATLNQQFPANETV